MEVDIDIVFAFAPIIGGVAFLLIEGIAALVEYVSL